MSNPIFGEPEVGGKYNWVNQPERLSFMGKRKYHGDPRTWYLFEKVDQPGKVWCEVLYSDLHMLEATKP